MCLYVNGLQSNNVRRKLQKGPVVFYKRFNYQRSKTTDKFELVSPHMNTPLVLSKGYFVSNRQNMLGQISLTESEKRDGSVLNGIHVYLLQSWVHRHEIGMIASGKVKTAVIKCYHADCASLLIPVVGHLKEFVAAGNGEAVFTKIKINPAILKDAKAQAKDALKIYAQNVDTK